MPPLQPVVLIVTTQTWQQLTRMAVRLSHYGCRVSVMCPAQSELQFFERLHTCHTFKPDSPLPSLEAAIIKSGADYLVPGDDPAVWLLHELCERSPIYKRLIEQSLGPAHFYATVRSRYCLLSLAASLGIDVPETGEARTLEDAKAWSSDRATPFLLKKDGTWGGGGVEVVYDASVIDQHYARLVPPPGRLDERQQHLPAGKTTAAPRSWISDAEVSVQAYIEGVAANGMFACDKGRILGSVQARVVAAKGKNGPALLIDLVEDPRIERAAELLADSLQLSGFFGLDFVVERETGIPYLIEMNPRCTQMGHIALSNHADLAGLLWARWSGQEPPAPANRELATSICFYPQPQRASRDFLDRARLDVCAEDRDVIDRLAKGNPALLARLYRAVRNQLKMLKHNVTPPQPDPIYYFEAESSYSAEAGRAESFLAEDCGASAERTGDSSSWRGSPSGQKTPPSAA